MPRHAPLPRPPARPFPAPRSTPRRAVLGALSAAAVGTGLVASGCLPGRSGTASAGGHRAAAAPDAQITPAPAQAAGDLSDAEVDAAVLDQALVTTREAVARLAAVGERYPGLAGAVAGLLAMHRAHLAVLADAEPDGSVPATEPPVDVPGRSARALAEARKAATRDQRQFAELAVQARSGPFARLLASISAAIGQQLAVLPRPQRGAP